MNKVKMTTQQKNIIHLCLLNFVSGFLFFATSEILHDLITTGLYHKIIPLAFINFPIGIIGIIIIVCLATFLFILIISIDYNMYKKGIENKTEN